MSGQAQISPEQRELEVLRRLADYVRDAHRDGAGVFSLRTHRVEKWDETELPGLLRTLDAVQGARSNYGRNWEVCPEDDAGVFVLDGHRVKIVPVEPTERMVHDDSANDPPMSHPFGSVDSDTVRYIYKQLLRVAPQFDLSKLGIADDLKRRGAPETETTAPGLGAVEGENVGDTQFREDERVVTDSKGNDRVVRRWSPERMRYFNDGVAASMWPSNNPEAVEAGISAQAPATTLVQMDSWGTRSERLHKTIEEAEHKPGTWTKAVSQFGAVASAGQDISNVLGGEGEQIIGSFGYKRDGWLATAAVNALPELLEIVGLAQNFVEKADGDVLECLMEGSELLDGLQNKLRAFEAS